ncbi:sodium:solute symporter family transporter [Mycoplasmopsis cricetuli]|uniref:sodium:solute symporter family transporter n=1 Tax=Mycoplasmopsis cricetuli TaxID=171283 RepID=UPI00046EE8CB|nr:hypothetical protein [Mycoplasmopsis cricetuli]
MKKTEFTVLDWVVMVVYLIAVLIIPLVFYLQARRNKNFDSAKYLAAKGEKVPSVVVGLSIWATGLSSLTFLATPGLAFKTGWMWAFGQLTILLITPYLIKIIIPFYRRIKGSTGYQYLENRFNYLIRFIASVSFILFHIFRIAIVLYIPTLTLSLFIDINIYLLMFIIGLVVVIGTFLGGFKGILWTDAIQGFVLFAGIILIVIFGLALTDFSVAKIQNVLSIKQFEIKLASGGVIIIFLSSYVQNMFSYTASQDIVQRYKAGKTISTAYKSIYVNVILVAITILVFYAAGSVLYSYYSSLGYNVDDPKIIDSIVGRPNSPNNTLVSYFIVTSLPMGISGLIVAAVFAASQSTISSSLNSLVTTLITDVLEKKWKIKDKFKLVLSKIFICIFGVLGVLVAITIHVSGINNLISYFISIVGLLGGPLAGAFFLGLFTKKTNATGVMIGIFISFAITLPIWVLATFKFIVFAGEYIALVSFAIFMIVTYPASLLFKPKKETNLMNLTIWTKTKEFVQLEKLEKEVAKLERKAKKNKEISVQLEQKMQQIAQLDKIVFEQTNM